MLNGARRNYEPAFEDTISACPGAAIQNQQRGNTAPRRNKLDHARDPLEEMRTLKGNLESALPGIESQKNEADKNGERRPVSEPQRRNDSGRTPATWKRDTKNHRYAGIWKSLHPEEKGGKKNPLRRISRLPSVDTNTETSTATGHRMRGEHEPKRSLAAGGQKTSTRRISAKQLRDTD